MTLKPNTGTHMHVRAHTHTHTHTLDWARLYPAICPALSNDYLLDEELTIVFIVPIFEHSISFLFKVSGWLMPIFECATCAILLQTKCSGNIQNGQAVGEQKETGAIWEEAACESDVDRAPGGSGGKGHSKGTDHLGHTAKVGKGKGYCLVVWYGCMTHI